MVGKSLISVGLDIDRILHFVFYEILQIYRQYWFRKFYRLILSKYRQISKRCVCVCLWGREMLHHPIPPNTYTHTRTHTHTQTHTRRSACASYQLLNLECPILICRKNFPKKWKKWEWKSKDDNAITRSINQPNQAWQATKKNRRSLFHTRNLFQLLFSSSDHKFPDLQKSFKRTAKIV